MVEGQAGDASRRDWSSQRLAVLGNGCVPDLDHAIVTAGGQFVPVGLICQAIDSTPMAGERKQVLTRGRIPEHDSVIVAGGSKATAVGTERELIHAVSMPGQFMAQAAVRRVVKPHYRIVAASYDCFPVRTEAGEHRRRDDPAG